MPLGLHRTTLTVPWCFSSVLRYSTRGDCPTVPLWISQIYSRAAVITLVVDPMWLCVHIPARTCPPRPLLVCMSLHSLSSRYRGWTGVSAESRRRIWASSHAIVSPMSSHAFSLVLVGKRAGQEFKSGRIFGSKTTVSTSVIRALGTF